MAAETNDSVALLDENEVLLLLDDLSGYISADLDHLDSDDESYAAHISEPENLFWRLRPDSQITPKLPRWYHPYFDLDSPFASDERPSVAPCIDTKQYEQSDGSIYVNPHYFEDYHLNRLFDPSPIDALIEALAELTRTLRRGQRLLLFRLPAPAHP